jgi:L-histidine Nalpha-methyltransferase
VRLAESKIEIIEPKQCRDGDNFARAVERGLSAENKSLPCKYIYDERGSCLFSEIMNLPEYYPTRCEKEILTRYRSCLSDYLGDEPFHLVDLGAGDGRKTKLLLRQFTNDGRKFSFVPIDISQSSLECMANDLEPEFCDLKLKGLVADYFKGLEYLSHNNRERNFVLFLGSNIGNFNREESREFLTGLRNSLNDGDLLLIGFDLKKKTSVMVEAYNDSAGISAQFNLNLLNRINGELGGEFDLDTFKYYSNYEARQGAIVSCLLSTRKQTVFIDALDREFDFGKWEPIHTESSYKFGIEQVHRLARDCGFEIEDDFFDSRRWFVDSLWRAR